MSFLSRPCRPKPSLQNPLSLFYILSQLHVARGRPPQPLACQPLVKPSYAACTGLGWLPPSRNGSPGLDFGVLPRYRCFSSEAAISETMTSDGMTMDDIVAKGWPILDESEGDWRSHAAAAAQSLHLIKTRLQLSHNLKPDECYTSKDDAYCFMPTLLVPLTQIAKKNKRRRRRRKALRML